MIELYSGTPGSGKSLHTAKEIRTRLRMHKRVIIGNFFINTKAVKKCKGNYLMVMNDRLTPDRLLRFSRHMSHHLGRRMKEGEILLVIDEAQLLFNSREWQNISRNGWLSFFSQHRHYGYDIILIAQFDRMLDRQVRCLLEYESVHRKVSKFGYIGFFVGLFTGGNLYVSVKRWYPIKEKVEGSFFFGSKKVFAIYDSYNHFDAPGQSTKTNSSKSGLSNQLARSGQSESVSGDLRGPTITLTLPGVKKVDEEELGETDMELLCPAETTSEEPIQEVDDDLEFLDLSEA